MTISESYSVSVLFNCKLNVDISLSVVLVGAKCSNPPTSRLAPKRALRVHGLRFFHAFLVFDYCPTVFLRPE